MALLLLVALLAASARGDALDSEVRLIFEASNFDAAQQLPPRLAPADPQQGIVYDWAEGAETRQLSVN